MGEEEQEPTQTPSPFHCFSLPRASSLEGNPTCGSQGNLRFIPRASSRVDLGTMSGTSPIRMNSPPGPPSPREFPEPQARCDPSPRDFISQGDCSPPAPQIQGRKEREHHPRRTQGQNHHSIPSPLDISVPTAGTSPATSPLHQPHGAKCADPEPNRSPRHVRVQEEAPTSPVTLSKTRQKPRNPEVLLLQWIFCPWARAPYPGVTHSKSIKVCWSRMFFPPKGASSGSRRFTVQQEP